MAADDRTEKPTAKRRGEARHRGQVAKSTDLTNAVVLVGGLVGVLLLGQKIVDNVANVMTSTFAEIAHPGNVSTGAGLGALGKEAGDTLLSTVAPIFAICIAAAIVVNVAQVGFRPSLGALSPASQS